MFVRGGCTWKAAYATAYVEIFFIFLRYKDKNRNIS